LSFLSKTEYRNPWAWVPTLYFAEGIPYITVMIVSVIMYKRLGISNTDIALYTSWLYLPWVIKPLWSPVVDIVKTKRFWIVIMQLMVSLGLLGIGLTLHLPNFFLITLIIFWFLAFSSATHDIAADGFYMLGLNQYDQSFFVGIRSTFYRLASITGQGLVVILAGYLENRTKNISSSWSITFIILAALFILFFIYHKFILPYPKTDVLRKEKSFQDFLNEFVKTFVSFFKKGKILIILGFLLLFRFAEAQLVKIASLFLLDSRDVGGLGLSTEQVGLVYGTIGVIALTLGGILGGVVAARNGLKHWIWFMVVSINIPDLVYVYLSFVQPSDFISVIICVALEQFGYGFGFTAYMLYMIYVSEGEFKTAHYAICTGFMALGMMLPGMFSGWLQETIGYQNFFVWVCIATIPAFIITKFIPLDPKFGKKKE